MTSKQPLIQDYKQTSLRAAPPQKRWHWFAGGLLLPLALISIVVSGRSAPDSPTPAAGATANLAIPNQESIDSATGNTVKIAADIPEETIVAAPPEKEGEQLLLTVKSGDSLDRLFRRSNLSLVDLTMLMRQDLTRKYLRLLKPGDEIEIRHLDGKVLELTREIDLFSALTVTREADTFVAQTHLYDIHPKQTEASGRISSSLFLAAAEAGISDRTIMNMAGMFAWDIDFVLDIREGDEFIIIYEELWRDGELLTEGEILAAEFINQGKSYRALRYTSPDGETNYFTPEGENVRKAFLRAPLNFARISSNFNPRRRHPKLNTIRAHQGVDYAAARGTAIKAAGNGKIIFRGVKGGYGNTIILQHGDNITTLYAHLNGFSRDYRNGAKVQQGNTIGFVGATGLATGPHLHYEYRKNGVHMNPRTVNLPDAEPIDPALRASFLENTESLLLKLESQRQMLASLDPADNT
jgi:murein DD-endopeptidase MepM/ murein hydrolase activator NlpD